MAQSELAVRPVNGRTTTVKRSTIHPDLPVHAETVMVDPALAQRWLDDCQYEFQRRVRSWHVDELAYALKAGQFKPGSIEFYHYEGRDYLTDGQHRLRAIVESGVAAVLVVIRVQARSMEEVAAAYYRTDAGLSRPFTEAIPLSGVLEQTGLTDKEVSITSSATRFIQYGFTDKASTGRRLAERNRDVRFQAVLLWASDAKSYFSAIESRDELLERAMVTLVPVAVGIITFHYEPERASEFWSTIAENDGLRKGTPEHAAFGVLASAGKEKLPLNLYARKLAYCWNAAYEGRQVNHGAIVRDPKKPILLKGTPYDGVRTLRYGPDMKLITEED